MMTNLTGKDKAVAEALINAGFELADLAALEEDDDEEDPDFYAYFTEEEFNKFTKVFGGVENWLVWQYDEHFVAAEETISKEVFVLYAGLDLEDIEQGVSQACQIISSASRDFEASIGQLSLFDLL